MAEWIPPTLDNLENRYATSILEEFVLGHSPSDVLTELVQNEFDARGAVLDLMFQDQGLEVRGSGRPIDADGWKRLSVVLGTGHSMDKDGNTLSIPPKQNGVGSKNFGVRSLFFFGDQIYIRSSGKQTVKDFSRGASPSPLPDESTSGRRGVFIYVPYRSTPTGRLQPFTVSREREVFDILRSNLQYTLVKLALPGAPRNLRELKIGSNRTGRTLTWVQSARRVPTKLPGSIGIERTVKMKETTPEAPGKWMTVLKELEFQALCSPTDLAPEIQIPTYFTAKNGRIRIGVSLRLTRGHLEMNQPGIFYYPLGLRDAHTGNPISITAPFVLDQDRSRLVPSHWNNWLLTEAAKLVIRFLKSDWFARFGPEAFQSLQRSTAPPNTTFLDAIFQGLKEEKCWPSAHSTNSGKPVFKAAREIVLTPHPELGGFLTPDRYLSRSLTESKFSAQILRLAEESESKTFGLDSLIRLRSAGKEASLLATNPISTGQANYHFTDFQSQLSNIGVQIRIAEAVQSLRRRLSEKNRQDLRDAPATLAADGSLRPAKDLFLVNPLVAATGPVPPSSQLHPELLRFGVIASLCKPFAEDKWLSDVASRIGTAKERPQERDALSRYVISKQGHLSRKILQTLRELPILRDHKGEWVNPSQITLRSTPSSKDFEPVLHFPNEEYNHLPDLAKRLRFKRQILNTDFIAMARYVAENPLDASTFEATLERGRNHLTPKTWHQLSEIPFLRSSGGTLASPNDLYIKSPFAFAVLGPSVSYVSGTRSTLYGRLGCQETPRSIDIVSHLTKLAITGQPLSNADTLYPGLVSVLRKERVLPTSYRTARIIWAQGEYHAPDDLLVGSSFFPGLRSVLPHVLGPKPLVEALKLLGAHVYPQPYHWRDVFNRIGGSYGATGGPITRLEVHLLREAYKRLRSTGLPDGIGPTTKCLLGRDMMLYSLADVRLGTLVINDDPDLADAVQHQSKGISFPDPTPGTHDFFNTFGLQRLTEIVGVPRPLVGGEQTPPYWFDGTKRDEVLDQLHSPDFASALVALAHSRGVAAVDESSLMQRLDNIRMISFVHQLRLCYDISGYEVVVPSEAWPGSDRISLVRVTSRLDLNQLLASALARIITMVPERQQILADSIGVLLACSSPSQMSTYLRRRGVHWEPPTSGHGTDDDPQEGIQADPSDHPPAPRTLRFPLRRSVPTNSGQGNRSAPGPAKPPSSRRSLAPLQSVTPHLINVSLEELILPAPTGSPRKGSRYHRAPLVREDPEFETAIGLRGEELVFRLETQRVKDLGLDESLVVWVSKSDPLADHDIRSVDAVGQPIWIEVKSTVGTGGRFRWSMAEYNTAVREGNRYQLWRVYEADTRTPSLCVFPDPVSLIKLSKMTLNVSGFWVEVPPIGPIADRP